MRGLLLMYGSGVWCARARRAQLADEEAYTNQTNSQSRSSHPKTHSNISLVLICLALLLCGAGLELARHSWADGRAVSAVEARLAELELVKADNPIQNSTLDSNKLAVIIEKRDLPVLVPVLLDFLIKVPESWPFQLWTSQETATAVGSSRHIQPYIKSGKLQLKLLPDNGDHINSGQTLSEFLTAPFWWQQLAPAEQ